MTADRHIMADDQTKCSHTPGPWFQLKPGSACIEAPSGNVAVTNLARASVADARLIAAAPELLQGMKDLYRAYVNLLEAGRDRITTYGGQCDSVETMERGDPWLKKARDVVAKAEGRS